MGGKITYINGRLFSILKPHSLSLFLKNFFKKNPKRFLILSKFIVCGENYFFMTFHHKLFYHLVFFLSNVSHLLINKFLFNVKRFNLCSFIFLLLLKWWFIYYLMEINSFQVKSWVKSSKKEVDKTLTNCGLISVIFCSFFCSSSTKNPMKWSKFFAIDNFGHTQLL